jgi:hypothetical protein
MMTLWNSKLRMPLTRKLLQSKVATVKNDLPGTLRNFCLAGFDQHQLADQNIGLRILTLCCLPAIPVARAPG